MPMTTMAIGIPMMMIGLMIRKLGCDQWPNKAAEFIGLTRQARDLEREPNHSELNWSNTGCRESALGHLIQWRDAWLRGEAPPEDLIPY